MRFGTRFSPPRVSTDPSKQGLAAQGRDGHARAVVVTMITFKYLTRNGLMAAALLASPLFCELSVRVRKRMAVRLFSGLLSRFDADEDLVPFVMLA
jgi:hypothetical protein